MRGSSKGRGGRFRVFEHECDKFGTRDISKAIEVWLLRNKKKCVLTTVSGDIFSNHSTSRGPHHAPAPHLLVSPPHPFHHLFAHTSRT